MTSAHAAVSSEVLASWHGPTEGDKQQHKMPPECVTLQQRHPCKAWRHTQHVGMNNEAAASDSILSMHGRRDIYVGEELSATGCLLHCSCAILKEFHKRYRMTNVRKEARDGFRTSESKLASQAGMSKNAEHEGG